MLSLALSITFAGTQAIAQRHKPASDDTIANQVRMKLATDSEVKGGALDVTVKDGVVTMRGRVPTEKARSKYPPGKNAPLSPACASVGVSCIS